MRLPGIENRKPTLPREVEPQVCCENMCGLEHLLHSPGQGAEPFLAFPAQAHCFQRATHRGKFSRRQTFLLSQQTDREKGRSAAKGLVVESVKKFFGQTKGGG